MESISLFIPIGICVILPVMLAFFYFTSENNKTNRRAEVITKAIEANICPEKLEEIFDGLKMTAEEILQIRLLRGCIFTLLGISSVVLVFLFPNHGFQRMMCFFSAACLSIGIGYLIVFFVTRKTLKETN